MGVHRAQACHQGTRGELAPLPKEGRDGLGRAHRLVRAVPGVQVSGAVSRAAVARWCAASLHHALHLPAACANGCEGLCHCSR